jgi:hypothetical protein
MIMKVSFCKTLKSLRSTTRYFVTAIHYIRFKLSERLCFVTGKPLPTGWRSTMPPSSGSNSSWRIVASINIMLSYNNLTVVYSYTLQTSNDTSKIMNSWTMNLKSSLSIHLLWHYIWAFGLLTDYNCQYGFDLNLSNGVRFSLYEGVCLLSTLSLIFQNIQNNFHGVLTPRGASFNLPFI